VGILNATTATGEGFVKEHVHCLTPDEQVLVAFKTIRDWIVFTDWRVIHVDVQGLTGSKKQYKTVPYRSIAAYSIESAGTFDLDGEIKLYLSGMGSIDFKVGRDSDVTGLQTLMAEKLNA